MTTLTNLTAVASLALCIGCDDKRYIKLPATDPSQHYLAVAHDIVGIYKVTRIDDTWSEVYRFNTNYIMEVSDRKEVIGYQLMTADKATPSFLFLYAYTNNLEPVWRFARKPETELKLSGHDVQFLTFPTNLYVTNTIGEIKVTNTVSVHDRLIK